MSTAVVRRRRGWRFVVAAWALSRLLLLLPAAAVARKMHWGLTKLVMHWDAEYWYNPIAQHGYTTRQAYAFFPGWPMVLRAFDALGVPIAWSGVAISTLCALGAALALWRIGGERYGAWAAAAWCFAPMTVFTSVVYTESLFCVLGFWAWERMLRGRWAQMAVLLALACTVRITGVFLVIGVFVWILTRRRTAALTPARRVLPTLWLALPTAVVLAWAAYLHSISGDWMAWYTAQQQGWNRGFTMPWQTVYKTLLYAGPLRDQTSLGFSEIQIFEILSWIIGGVVGVWCLLKRRWGEAAYVLIQFVGLGTADYLISVNRALLVWFPAWLLVGRWLAGERRRPLRLAYVACCALLVVAWGYLCFRGYWCS